MEHVLTTHRIYRTSHTRDLFVSIREMRGIGKRAIRSHCSTIASDRGHYQEREVARDSKRSDVGRPTIQSYGRATGSTTPLEAATDHRTKPNPNPNQPNRTEPNRTEPNRTEPKTGVPIPYRRCKATLAMQESEPNQTKPNRTTAKLRLRCRSPEAMPSLGPLDLPSGPCLT